MFLEGLDFSAIGVNLNKGFGSLKLLTLAGHLPQALDDDCGCFSFEGRSQDMFACVLFVVPFYFLLLWLLSWVVLTFALEIV